MSKIKSRDTQPELLVRRFLFSNGLRYKLCDSKLPGKPDIVLPKYKTVIFVHGCFWHGHSHCHLAKLPKTRTEFWTKKIHENKIRDKENISQLEKNGWQVLLVYGCELKKQKKDATLNNLLNKIKESLNSEKNEETHTQ